jgi:hypothetical protein
MNRKLIFSLSLFIWIAGLFTHPLKAEAEGKSANKTPGPNKISLAEVEPAIYYSFFIIDDRYLSHLHCVQCEPAAKYFTGGVTR